MEPMRPNINGPDGIGLAKTLEVVEVYSGELSRSSEAFYANFIAFLSAEWERQCLRKGAVPIACWAPSRVVVYHNGDAVSVTMRTSIDNSEASSPPYLTTNIREEMPVQAARRLARETAENLGLFWSPTLRQIIFH